MFDSSLVLDVDYSGKHYLLIIGEWLWQLNRLNNRCCREYLDKIKIRARFKRSAYRRLAAALGFFGEVSA